MKRLNETQIVLEFDYAIVSARAFRANRKELVDPSTCRVTLSRSQEGGIIFTSMEKHAEGCPQGTLMRLQDDEIAKESPDGSLKINVLSGKARKTKQDPRGLGTCSGLQGLAKKLAD